MRPTVVVAAVLGAVGLTLLLGELRWFRRRRLHQRLAPFVVTTSPHTRSPLSTRSVREMLTPLAQTAGATVSRLFGVQEDLGIRLERIHADIDVPEVRLRQLGWSVAAVGCGLALTLATRPPAPVALLLVLGTPLLCFLLIEQRVAGASTAWQQRTVGELPVVAEQLGMLLQAGYSLTSALNRIAERSSGACATDLALACRRTRHGVDELAALREWAERVRVPAVDRLVAVLALNREGADLGALIAEEARAIRADAHRDLLQAIERRTQQVWIPVTVATLVPGVLFLAVPFIDALSLFGAT